MGRVKPMDSPQGMGSLSITGRKPAPMAARLPAMKFQYLKKPSRARLKITDEATAIRAPLSLPFALHRVTIRPWE